MTWTLLPASQFAAHAARWQALNAATANSPLLEPDFVAPLLTEFASDRELLAIYERGGEPLAMAVMTPRRRGVWETFQPSQAPIGLWLQLPGVQLDQLLDELLRKLPGFPLVLSLIQRDPALAPRPADGGSIQTLDYVDTAKITLNGSFEDYWATRGKNLRTNMKKQRTKLAKEEVTARMESSRAPEDMAAAVADYGRLESAGWKAQGGTAIHPDNAQGRFYTGMLENFCRRGAASVKRYWFNDRLVAMNLCIEGDGSMIILKTTYDESVDKSFSPAFLMLEETCQQLYAEKTFNRLEFYGKVMEWHLRWTDEVRSLYHVNNYRWPALLSLHTMLKNRAAAAKPQPAPIGADAKPTAE